MKIKNCIGLLCFTLVACTSQENANSLTKIQKDDVEVKIVSVITDDIVVIEASKEIMFPFPVKIFPWVSVEDSIMDFITLCEKFGEYKPDGNNSSECLNVKIKSERGLYVVNITKIGTTYKNLVINKQDLPIIMDQGCDGFQGPEGSEFIFAQNDTFYSGKTIPVEITSLDSTWLEKFDGEYLKVLKYLKEILNNSLTTMAPRKRGHFLFAGSVENGITVFFL